MLSSVWQAHGGVVAAALPTYLYVLLEHLNVLRRSTFRTRCGKIGMLHQQSHPMTAARLRQQSRWVKGKATDLCLKSCVACKTVIEYRA